MTQEQTFTVGLDGRLVATLTLPHALAAVNDAPIALLTNSGVISRVGPHRLNVRIARWLAARGTASIRFDLSGVGDSRRAPGTRPQIEQWVADTLQVMDWAARRFGNDAFFMVGFCSGAEVAYRTAMVDARLRGLVLWDMVAYPTPKSRRLALMFRLRRAGVAGVAIKAAGRARRLLGAPVPPAQKPQQLQALEPQQPPPLERLAADLQTLVERGTQVKVMFCGGEPEWYSYPEQFHESMAGFPGVVRNVPCEYLAASDHLLTQRASRDAFVASLQRWFDAALMQNIAPPLPSARVA